MRQRTKQLALAGALTAAAAGLGIYASQDPSGGQQRAGRLLERRGCDVTITAPAAAPGGRLELSAGQSLAVTLTGRALRCPGGTVTVTAVVNHGEATTLGTAVVSAAGAWTFGPTTLADQSETVLTAGMTSTVNDASTATSAVLTVNASTGRPRVVLTTPAPAGDGRIRVVACAADAGCGSGGNAHAEHREPGYYHDQACDAGGQVSPVLTVYGGCQGHGDAGYDAGCEPGSLAISYGITPLASVAVVQDPQTFTAAELGVWTLDDWTRDDLVLRAACGGDAGVAEVAYDLQVGTGSPPAVVSTTRIVHERHADFDIDITLPATVAPVTRPVLEVFWTSDTLAASASVALGTVALGATPTALPTAPGTCAVQNVVNSAVADAGVPIWCGLTSDVTVETGTRIAPAYWSYGWVLNNAQVQVEGPDAGFLSGGWSACGTPSNPKATVYCVTGGGTGSVTVTAVGCCQERTHDFYANRAKADHVVSCWGVGSEDGVQLWECKDGRRYRGGDVYVEHVLHQPPLQSYYLAVQVVW